MTTEEFWKKYTKENSLEIFDITCDFFQRNCRMSFWKNIMCAR